MRYLSEISWRHSWDFDTQFPNNYEFFYVCQSVSLLCPYWNKKNMGISLFLDDIYFWKIFETSWDIGSLCLAELTYWLSSFCVLVLTLKPLVLLPFGSLGVSFWDLWSCYVSSYILRWADSPTFTKKRQGCETWLCLQSFKTVSFFTHMVFPQIVLTWILVRVPLFSLATFWKRYVVPHVKLWDNFPNFGIT